MMHNDAVYDAICFNGLLNIYSNINKNYNTL